MVCALSACSNNLQEISRATGLDPTGNADVSNTSAGQIRLVQIIANNLNPTSEVDLIGTGNEFRNYCRAGDGSSSTTSASGTGKSTCTCAYEYQRTGAGVERVEVDTVYFESNLIRCPYGIIPSDISSAKVRVHANDSDTYSNQLILNLNGSGTVISPSSTTTFAKVERYQCRDYVTVKNMLCRDELSSTCMYDPFQSESTTMSYPFDFYTTNLGGAIYAQALASSAEEATSWDCSMDPDNPQSWENKKIYSVGGDTSGSKLIAPPHGDFDRSTFYVAKKPTSVFNVALNAVIAPDVVTSTGGDHPPIGYGARPIPTSNGEVCPTTSVTIPTGYKWVKVWAFRGAHPVRKYVQGSQETLNNGGAIFCNPGTFTSGGADYVFKDCGATATSITALASKLDLSSRVLLNNTTSLDPDASVCVNVINHAGARVAGKASTAYSANVVTHDFPDGTDYYRRIGATTLDAELIRYNLADVLVSTATSDDFSAGDRAVPYDTDLLVNEWDDEARANYVFVVSPTTLMAHNMESMSRSGADDPQVYTPYTFRNTDDCNANDPDSNSGCISRARMGKKIPYELWRGDVRTAPSGNGGNSQNTVFPLCALQPE